MALALVVLMLAGIAVLLVVVIYIRPAQKIIAKRRQFKKLESIENLRVSGRSLKSLTYSFAEGEDKVYWADRQHLLVFLQIGGPLLLVSLAGLGLALLIGLRPPTVRLHNSASDPSLYHQTTFHWLWLLPLLFSVGAGLAGWDQWLRWRSVFRLITNEHLILPVQPWAWASWLWNDERYDPQPLTAIISVERINTFGGRVFGYGTVLVKTFQMENEDEGLNVHFVRDHEAFAHLLEELRIKSKDKTQTPMLTPAD